MNDWYDRWRHKHRTCVSVVRGQHHALYRKVHSLRYQPLLRRKTRPFAECTSSAPSGGLDSSCVSLSLVANYEKVVKRNQISLSTRAVNVRCLLQFVLLRITGRLQFFRLLHVKLQLLLLHPAQVALNDSRISYDLDVRLPFYLRTLQSPVCHD